VAPEAFRVAQLPAHTDDGLKFALITGAGATVIGIVFCAEQAPFEPITVYVVLTAGETIILLPRVFPGSQVKDVAPLAERVTELPKQTVVEVGVTMITGTGLTTTVVVSELVQPEALEAVTVYT
jgi:hypothetical protein